MNYEIIIRSKSQHFFVMPEVSREFCYREYWDKGYSVKHFSFVEYLDAMVSLLALGKSDIDVLHFYNHTGVTPNDELGIST